MELPNWLARAMRKVEGRSPDGFVVPEQYGELVVEEQRVRKWADFQRWISGFDEHWSFRGQSLATWGLETTLERKTTQIVAGESEGFNLEASARLNPAGHEARLLAEFQRAAHQYLPRTPGDDEIVDWLALMQHHGAPTRLLDWTRSPYVALYFALEQARPHDQSAIWALDGNWVQQASFDTLSALDTQSRAPIDLKGMNQYVSDAILKMPKSTCVVAANPLRLSERMAAQQGHFFCSLSHNETFGVSLFHMIEKYGIHQPLKKLLIEPGERAEFLSHLHWMNIHTASLFPGLDGFARSLGIELETRVEFDRRAVRDSLSAGILRQRESDSDEGESA